MRSLHEVTPPLRLIRNSADRLGSCAGVMLLAAYLSGCAGAPRGADVPFGYPVGYHERGMASWYGPGFDGHRTANGERFDMRQLTAAHRTLPFGSMVQVRSLVNDRQVMVRINDRGPFSRGRVLDLSYAAALQLGMIGQGTHWVELTVLSYRGSSEKDGGLWIQVGSFDDKTHAHDAFAKLKQHYSEVRIVAIDLPTGTRYRVQVGRFTTEREAAAVADQIDRQFHVESLVVRDKT